MFPLSRVTRTSQPVDSQIRLAVGPQRCSLRLYLRRAQPRLSTQDVRLVRLLPGRVYVLAAEVAVAGRRLVDRPPQVQPPDDRLRPQVEVPPDQGQHLILGHPRRPERLNRY